MAKRNIIPPTLDITNARQVYAVTQSRDFYKGTSFQMNKGWFPDTHYYNDEFIVSFVSYDGALIFCKKNHMSSIISMPIVIKDEEGLVIGIEPNDYWDFVSGGTPGPMGEDGKTWVPQINDGILTWTLEDVPPTQDVNIKGEPGKDAYTTAKEQGYPFDEGQFAKDLSEISDKVRRSGDTMEGRLLLNESPTDASPDLQAATKQYVDEKSINTYHTFDEKYFDEQDLYVTLQKASIDDEVVSNISQSKVTGLIDALNSKNGIVAAGTGIEISRDPVTGRTTISSVQDLFEVVSVRPAVGEPNKVYLVPKDDGSGQFEQWAYENGTWVDLGTSGATVDLTNYYNKQNVDSLLSQKANVSLVEQHINDVQNPHEVTAAQVGLGNVNNTSDLDKPISNATQAALGTKADVSQVVRIFGNQTIDGEKTFNTVPAAPSAPIRPQDLTNKSYVDTQLVMKANQADLAGETSARQIADANLDSKINTKMSRLVPGTNIQIDYSNPNAPIISSTASGGTNDHTLLINRSAPDQHPITAITGLEGRLSLKADDIHVVHRDGNIDESIDGVKTFVRIPIGPAENPTNANQLTRKGYVDGRIETVTNSIASLEARKQNKLVAGDNINIDETNLDSPIISAAGNVMDAPIDGIMYGRIDGEWADIESVKGFVPYTANGSVPVKSGGSVLGTLSNGATKRLVTLREVTSGPFTNLQIGDDLSGRTLSFNNSDFDVLSPAGSKISIGLEFNNGALLIVSSQEPGDMSGAMIEFTHLGAQDEVVYDYTHTPKWTRDTITFPENSVFTGYVSYGFPSEINSLVELDTYLTDWKFGLATLSVGNTSQVILGDGSIPAEIIGNQHRALYNGEEMALMSDLGEAGISEAPIDGKTYGRKDAAWTEVESKITVVEVDFTPEIDGIKTDFVLPEEAIGNSVVPFYNGQRLFKGYNYTYNEDTRTLSLLFTPEIGDKLFASIGEIEVTTEVNVDDVMVNGVSVVVNKIADIVIPEVDLSNYYTKDETYNKIEIDEKIVDSLHEFDNSYFTVIGKMVSIRNNSIGANAISSIPQSKVDNLGLDLANILTTLEEKANNDDLIAETARATNAENDLSTRIDNANTQISELQSALNDEIVRATTAEGDINTAITNEVSRATTVEAGLQTQITNVDNGLSAETERATAASQANTDKINTINTKIDQNVITNVAYGVSSTGVTRTTTKRNLYTETNSTTTENMPVVSATQAGIVLPDLFNTINNNTQRITNLEQSGGGGGGNRRLGVFNTKADLDNFVLPGDAKVGDTAVVTNDETHSNYATEYDLQGDPLTWTYLFTINTTTPIATQTTLGTVKGNTADGTVAVETDGSMSVNGYDTLKNSIPTAVGQLTNDVGYITEAQVVVPDATSTIKGIATLGASGGAARFGNKADVGLSNVDNTSDLSKPVSTATQTALNNKVDKVAIINRIYSTDGAGAQSTLPYSITATTSAIPQRDTNGNIAVLPSVTGNNAIGATQVDSKISTAVVGLAQDSTVVHNTGNETISGVKTFNSSPIVPTVPAGDTSAVNKFYVDNAISNIEETDPIFDAWKNSENVVVGRNAKSETGGGYIGSVAIGNNAMNQGVTNGNTIAIGYNAFTNANGAVQIGTGTNSTANTLQYKNYPLVNASGKIPNERLNIWKGTQAQYDAIVTKDPNVIYMIIEEV